MSSCIIGGTFATFDWSNMDLVNFQYFKYPATTTEKPFYIERHGIIYSLRKIPQPTNKLEDSMNRASAVVKYFKNLALGNPDEKIKSMKILDPQFGEKWSKHFQSKHGAFGEKLVDLLGSGISNEELRSSENLYR